MTISTQFVAGPYTGVWNNQNLGLVKEGFEIRMRISKNLVDQSNVYGQTVLDAVYDGMNCFIGYTLIEWFKGVLAGLVMPYANALLQSSSMSMANLGMLGTVGRMDVGSTLSWPLILTAVSGTTAASSPASLTAAQASIAEETDIGFMFNTRNREVPMLLRLYPYTLTSNDRFFSVT